MYIYIYSVCAFSKCLKINKLSNLIILCIVLFVKKINRIYYTYLKMMCYLVFEFWHKCIKNESQLA